VDCVWRRRRRCRGLRSIERKNSSPLSRRQSISRIEGSTASRRRGSRTSCDAAINPIDREIATDCEQDHLGHRPRFGRAFRARATISPPKNDPDCADDDEFIGFALARTRQVLGKTSNPFIPFRPLAVLEVPGSRSCPKRYNRYVAFSWDFTRCRGLR